MAIEFLPEIQDQISLCTKPHIWKAKRNLFEP